MKSAASANNALQAVFSVVGSGSTGIQGEHATHRQFVVIEPLASASDGAVEALSF
jgi:hypothetical protein